MKKSRINLRPGLERDVYAIVKKFEEANDDKPFKSIAAVYDAIKKSNSSLSRQKKRPLEDAIDRVLQFRKDELADSSDSEAEIEEPRKAEDDRFLLNRQMAKQWNTTPVIIGTSSTHESSDGTRSTKKRRIQEDGEKDGRVSGNEFSTPKVNGNAETDTQPEKAEKSTKKSKASRFKIELPTDAPRLGGIDDSYADLLRQTRRVLTRPEHYARTGHRRVPGIVLSGPPGIGKKSLVRLLAANIDVPVVSLNGCLEDLERMERSLMDAFDEAMRLAPCVILIEQLDWYMAKPGGSNHSENHRRVLTSFMRQMQRIQTDHDKDRHILAMATTSQITEVDPVALKTGLFEQTFQMRVPDLEARKSILKTVLKDVDLAGDVNLSELGKMTHGFVGADLVNLVTIAQQFAAERKEKKEEAEQDLLVNGSDGQPFGIVDTGAKPVYSPEDHLNLQDFKLAVKDYVPSLRKVGFSVIPSVTWSQVGALTEVREQLDMSIIGPIQDPNSYARAGLTRPAGCLLWGPPGCGKTLVAQAVANEAQASFILINGPELLNKYVGESERAVRELFNRARSSTPCILFFDEIDSLVPSRDRASTEAGTRIVNALLTELDGAQNREGVYVIGTTNRPDMIDAAILRPGRLNVHLFVDLPTPDERVDILRAIYRTALPSATPEELAGLEVVAKDERCKDFSGADLGGLQIKASENSLRRWRKGEKTELKVDAVDWEFALSKTNRSVLNPEMYRKLQARLGKGN